MFDLTSSKLLIVAIVALLVVGPKDLPMLLRTVGKYLGVIRRHANEFRAQLDEAIREAEMQELRKELEGVGNEMKSTIEEGARAIDTQVKSAREGIDSVLEDDNKAAASEDAYRKKDYRTNERAEQHERLDAAGQVEQPKPASAAAADEKTGASSAPVGLSDKTGT